jgi:hypothetical protein
MALTGNIPSRYKFIIIVLLGAILLLFPLSLPTGAGDWDLQAYWSSAYLFAHGRDFSDPIALGEIEHTLTTRDDPETLFSWFSPIGNVILLPFTLIPFTKAVYYWLILNVIILFYSANLIWGNSDSRIWIPLLAVFSFSMTVVSLVFGQINFLEVLGLALFISLSKSNRHYLAGAGLVLTTIKPHLVIITLPILLLDLLRKKDWKTLTGFFTALAFCFLVLFAFYPPWIQSFWTVVTSGMSTVRETPNINGLLVFIGEYNLGKLIWMITLIFGVIWWWRRGHRWNRRTFIDISVPAGLIVAPIGWSYDQIMLLFPILSLLSWIATGRLSIPYSKIIIAILIAANIFSYILRTFTPSDVWFFWKPILILGLYLVGQKQLHPSKSTPEHQQTF